MYCVDRYLRHKYTSYDLVLSNYNYFDVINLILLLSPPSQLFYMYDIPIYAKIHYIIGTLKPSYVNVVNRKFYHGFK